jgi:hypothetical protein
MTDEKDIPANFIEEDDDLLVNEPVCKRRLYNFVVVLQF